MRRSSLGSCCVLFVVATVLLVDCARVDVDKSRRRQHGPGGDPRSRAAALLAQMEQSEKISMTGGVPGWYGAVIPAVPRLGIPSLTLQDAGQGVGDGELGVTCFPSELAVTASWDTGLMQRFGAACGAEQRAKGTAVMLGPMMNIARVPFHGRLYESMGEDPYLAAKMAAASVSGIQSAGVMACAKHWSLNDQEVNRTTTSANGVDLRTAFEIYFQPFEAAVGAGVGSIMCSYNRINDTYSCENPETLAYLLKGVLGFQGFVMSDAGATHSTVDSALAGLDLEIPYVFYFGEALAAAVAQGQVPQSRLDDMILRILTSMFAAGFFDDEPIVGNITNNATSAEHASLARNLSAAGTVLLKNDGGLLPLPLPSGQQPVRVAVSGDDALLWPAVAGLGSGFVIPPYVVAPFDAIAARVNRSGGSATYAPTANATRAAALAAEADYAVVFVSVVTSEAFDRTTLSLGSEQDALVEAVAMAQPNTVVVAHVGGAVTMPWIDDVAAVLVAWMPGQESGNAIADVLFGDVNPSGRLPLTFPVSDNQTYLQSVEDYPGVDNECEYREGLLVGYRWYDSVGQEPLFPFGHGLSYSQFGYSDLQISTSGGGAPGSVVSVSFMLSLAESGAGPAGAEVVQLYVAPPASAGEPEQALRGFAKVFLEPGQQTQVTFLLEPRDFSVFVVSSMTFEPVPGLYQIRVGPSSRDWRLTADVDYP